MRHRNCSKYGIDREFRRSDYQRMSKSLLDALVEFEHQPRNVEPPKEASITYERIPYQSGCGSPAAECLAKL